MSSKDEDENINPYNILNIPLSNRNDKKFIKERFNRLIKVSHSDKGGDSNFHFIILQAYKVLMNPLKKYILDRFGYEFINILDDTSEEFMIINKAFQIIEPIEGESSQERLRKQDLDRLIYDYIKELIKRDSQKNKTTYPNIKISLFNRFSYINYMINKYNTTNHSHDTGNTKKLKSIFENIHFIVDNSYVLYKDNKNSNSLSMKSSLKYINKNKSNEFNMELEYNKRIKVPLINNFFHLNYLLKYDNYNLLNNDYDSSLSMIRSKFISRLYLYYNINSNVSCKINLKEDSAKVKSSEIHYSYDNYLGFMYKQGISNNKKTFLMNYMYDTNNKRQIGITYKTSPQKESLTLNFSSKQNFFSVLLSSQREINLFSGINNVFNLFGLVFSFKNNLIYNNNTSLSIFYICFSYKTCQFELPILVFQDKTTKAPILFSVFTFFSYFFKNKSKTKGKINKNLNLIKVNLLLSNILSFNNRKSLLFLNDNRPYIINAFYGNYSSLLNIYNNYLIFGRECLLEYSRLSYDFLMNYKSYDIDYLNSVSEEEVIVDVSNQVSNYIGSTDRDSSYQSPDEFYKSKIFSKNIFNIEDVFNILEKRFEIYYIIVFEINSIEYVRIIRNKT